MTGTVQIRAFLLFHFMSFVALLASTGEALAVGVISDIPIVVHQSLSVGPSAWIGIWLFLAAVAIAHYTTAWRLRYTYKSEIKTTTTDGLRLFILGFVIFVCVALYGHNLAMPYSTHGPFVTYKHAPNYFVLIITLFVLVGTHRARIRDMHRRAEYMTKKVRAAFLQRKIEYFLTTVTFLLLFISMAPTGRCPHVSSAAITVRTFIRNFFDLGGTMLWLCGFYFAVSLALIAFTIVLQKIQPIVSKKTHVILFLLYTFAPFILLYDLFFDSRLTAPRVLTQNIFTYLLWGILWIGLTSKLYKFCVSEGQHRPFLPSKNTQNLMKLCGVVILLIACAYIMYPSHLCLMGK